jgi:MFS family permease
VAQLPSSRFPRPRLLSAFSFPSFRRLWLGAFLSSVGTWTQDVALAWLIHSTFGNPAYLGLRAFAAEAPLLAFMLLGGALADRFDRRIILLISQVLQMAFAASLGVLYATGHLGILPILLFAFLTGLTQSQSAPTYQAVLTSVVPPAEIATAVAMNSLQFNLSRAIGPMIAGLLLAKVGAGACFAVNVVSFGAVIVALMRIQVPPPDPAKAREGLGTSLRAGLRLVRESPLLGLLVTVGGAASFLAFPLVTYLPVIAGEQLKTGAAGFSLLLSSFGAGAILGALATAQRGQAAGRGRVMLRGLAAYGVTSALAVLAPRQEWAMALLFLAGLSLVTGTSTLNSLVQENVPSEFKGRVLAIYGLAFRGGMPLGSLLAGPLVGRFGAPWVIASFSLALLLVALSLRLRNRRLAAL